MSTENKDHEKGKAFELAIGKLLEQLRMEYPQHVRFTYQPRLTLSSGELLIPDYELKVVLPFAEFGIMIECQHRTRSSTEIARKIRHAKSLSSRNMFVFVYADSIPNATAKSLQSDGVIHCSQEEFAVFLKYLGRSIRDEDDDDDRYDQTVHMILPEY